MRREKPTGTVKEIISKILKCDKKKVLVKSELVKDLGADSINILQMIIAIEREFKVEINDERLSSSVNGGGSKVKHLIDEVKLAVYAENLRIKPVRVLKNESQHKVVDVSNAH